MFYNVEGNELCIHRAYPQTLISPQRQAVTDRWLTTARAETLGTLLSLPVWALLIVAVWVVIR